VLGIGVQSYISPKLCQVNPQDSRVLGSLSREEAIYNFILFSKERKEIHGS